MTSMIICISLAVLYGALKVLLERHLAPLDAVGDDGDVVDVAFANGCSVYEVFQQAGDMWHFSRSKIERDFKGYLTTGEIPGYVRLFVKEQPTATRNRTYSKLLFSGGRPPYL